MANSLQENLVRSQTPYQTVENIKKQLDEVGATCLPEGFDTKLTAGKIYYIIKNGSAIITFKVGKDGFNIVAAHTDSPCLKLKHNPEVKCGKYVKFNVEKYGGGINYSWLDIPLSVAGRIVYRSNDGEVFTKNYVSPYTVIIPSLAVHLNREMNTSFTLNPQNHLQPLVSLDAEYTLKLPEIEKATAVDYDLFLVSAAQPYLCGAQNELLVSPRLDDLACVYSALDGFLKSSPKNTAVCCFYDNEEVGSSTKQGAGGTFLVDTLNNIAQKLGINFEKMKNNSIFVSADNAHAIHPNYPEKSDPTNPVILGGGVVIKNHANQNYTTDAFSSAVIKTLAEKSGAKTQDFFMRADMPCGGTLGAISSSQLSIISVDVGLPQLAMHSATETMAVADYDEGVKLFTQVFNAKIISKDFSSVKVE